MAKGCSTRTIMGRGTGTDLRGMQKPVCLCLISEQGSSAFKKEKKTIGSWVRDGTADGRWGFGRMYFPISGLFNISSLLCFPPSIRHHFTHFWTVKKEKLYFRWRTPTNRFQHRNFHDTPYPYPFLFNFFPLYPSRKRHNCMEYFS